VFNKGQIQGVLLSIAKPEIHVSRAGNTNIGYRVRIRVNIRGSEDFLLGVQRTLNQHNIESTYKDKEHKSRPRPILSISGIVNLWKLCGIIPDDVPDSKNVWKDFREIIDIIDNGEHHTLEGLDRILQLKGEI
tara:strand:- start:1335 stop:1733 length:399 start_codon:yes stop_codon:yes gene_type:complete